MPDMAMCDGHLCALAYTCYRNTAKPSPYQFYAPLYIEVSGARTFDNPTDYCQWYMKDERPR